MKNIFLLTIVIITSCLMPVTAQRHELGISVGKANLIGDIGKTEYIELFPMNVYRVPISLGILYRLNFNNRQGFRFNLVYNRLYFDDVRAAEDYRYKRLLDGDNTLLEASVLFEYSFFDINDIRHFGASPYIFGGVGVYSYHDRKYNITHQRVRNPDGSPRDPLSPYDFITEYGYKQSTKFDFSIPFGVGYKIKFKYNWILAFEVGARYTFQDNLDYSAIKTEDFNVAVDPRLTELRLQDPQLDSEINARNASLIGRNQTGNTFKSNDWYLVWGINLTYTFGRPPCYCY